MCLWLRRFSEVAAALTAAVLLSSCIAVGPDFLHPAAPEADRYTPEPLPPRTSSTDAPTGQAQRFVKGGDIPQQWWRLFRSRALNSLIERSLQNNPTLQSAMSALRVAKEAVYAQQGKFFPLAQANFNPTRQQTSGVLTPVLNTAQNPFDLYTAQAVVSYTFDVWGQNRRAVESLQAQADSERFQVEAAYLALTANVAVAAITEAALRGQIDATNELINLNRKMLDILRKQLDTGYANRSDVAAQEAQLAQVEATLPPLRKALAFQRDLLAALSGSFPSEGPRETFRLADLQLPLDLPLSLPLQLVEQRPDVRAAEELLHSASAQIGVATANMLPNFTISANGGYINSAPGFVDGPKVMTLRVSRSRYSAGSISPLDLLVIQRTYQQARIAQLQAQAARYADTAALFQALGGGWWNRIEPPKEKVLNVGTGESFTLVDPNSL